MMCNSGENLFEKCINCMKNLKQVLYLVAVRSYKYIPKNVRVAIFVSRDRETGTTHTFLAYVINVYPKGS